MAITRVKVWIAGEVLTASDLNNEFNNIINNLGSVVLTTMADGTVTAPGLSFFFDTNTGLYRIGADAAGFAANGLNVWVASEYFQASAFRFPVKTATESALTDQPGRAYWQSTEGSLHIHAGSLVARVPALTGVQAGDLITASNPTGVSGATVYARTQRPPVEHCRLVRETSTKLNLASGFIPLKVGGVWVRRDVHDPVELLSPTVTSNTLYYIYVYDDDGVTTLEASTTSHVAATQHGVRVKSGDETRTLVGAAFAGTAGAFSDSTTARMTASWFNRPGKVMQVTVASVYQTSQTSYVEIDSALRGQFVTWGETLTPALGGGDIRNDSANAFIFVALGAGSGATLNQPCDGAGGVQQTAGAGGQRFFWSAHTATSFAEGTGYFTPMFRVSSGNGVLTSSSAPERAVMRLTLNI